MWFVTRRRYDDDLTAAKSEIRRQRERAEGALKRAAMAEFNRSQVLRQNRELDAANRRLTGRIEELGRRNSALAESDPEYLADLEEQLAAVREQLAAETKRADHLQRRLDDAVGLPARGPIKDSSIWQPGYQPPKPKESTT